MMANLRPIVVVAALACASVAHAVLREATLDEVASTADAVVRARVIGMQSRWLDSPRIIVTDISLELGEVWAGDLEAGQPITVRVNGGEVQGLRMIQEHEPVFAAGEEVVLFLRQSTPELEPNGAGAFPNTFFRVHYVEAGKYVIADGKAVGIGRSAIPVASLRSSVRQKSPRTTR